MEVGVSYFIGANHRGNGYAAEALKCFIEYLFAKYQINVKDYTKEQLDVWATGQIDLEKWNQSFQEHFSLIAVDDSIITGFGDIDRTGYLDRLYVHADYQARGVATHICDRLEQAVPGDIVTHASITARPFFEKRGYKAVKEQQVERQGILLTNYVMIKASRQGCGAGEDHNADKAD